MIGTIGCVPGRISKPACGHPFPELAGVGHQLVAQFRAFGEQIEDGDAGTDDRRRESVAEEVGAGALPQELDDFLATRGEAAGCAAQRLAERRRDDVDPAHDVAVFVRATSILAEEAGAMGVVDHHQGVVAFRQIADLVEFGDIAVHAECAVGRDHPVAGALCVLELRFQISHVVVLVDEAIRPAKPHTVDDRGVVQGVGDDRIFVAQ